MKSTQDLAIFVCSLDQHLRQMQLIRIGEQVSLEIFADKSFRIYRHANSGDIIYDSDEQDHHVDINDLPYADPKEFAQRIKEDLSVRDIQVTDL